MIVYWGTMKEILKGMITTLAGGISSKIVIGAITYVALIITLIVLMFVNPDFPGLSDIFTTSIITSGALLGLTTFENLKNIKIGQKEEENSNNN